MPIECGSISEPPRRDHLTVWGIVELILMFLAAGYSLYYLYFLFKYNSRISLAMFIIIGIIVLTIAGLYFVIRSMFSGLSAHLKAGLGCFIGATGCIIAIVVISIINGYFYVQDFFILVGALFICFILIKQSSYVA